MKVVGIGAGHTWDTPGKQTPDGYKEINFNMHCKKETLKELKRCGIKAIDLNITGNEDIESKWKKANINNVHAAVEIHYNAFLGAWGEWGGIETLCHINAPASGGKKLARDIHSYLIQGTKMKDRGIVEKKWKFCAGIDAPAALVECGFMDNKREAELMRSIVYIKECAQEICKGICKFLGVAYICEPALGESKDEIFYRVVTGSYNNKENAEKQIKKLKKAGFDSFITVYKK